MPLSLADGELAFGRRFAVDVSFTPGCRKTPPTNGYRPHIILDTDLDRELLGVCFYDLSPAPLGKEIRALCECIYEEQGVDYHKIAECKTFRVVEGPHTVGTGVVRENIPLPGPHVFEAALLAELSGHHPDSFLFLLHENNLYNREALLAMTGKCRRLIQHYRAYGPGDHSPRLLVAMSNAFQYIQFLFTCHFNPHDLYKIQSSNDLYLSEQSAFIHDELRAITEDMMSIVAGNS